MIGPIVEEIAAEYDGKLRVGKLDADQYGDILMQYQIMGIPTLLLFKGGEVVERIVGYQPKERIEGKLTSHLN
jgi:thioredoxin 1